MMTSEQANINHNDWHVYDERGMLSQTNVEVRRYDDGTVRIGNSLHREDELDIISDERIESKMAGWYLSR